VTPGFALSRRALLRRATTGAALGLTLVAGGCALPGLGGLKRRPRLGYLGELPIEQSTTLTAVE
jgi:hypothetical protein